ncbi:hypothetical protein [Thioclava sp. F28-4]|uniref:hypothetical protein n=1 Tax=Thioclava sp. F28-4 TaxID=1915315 RepID=UPI0011BA61CC|nr:hypothetical protein [Thioclava sp. F28-4]
MTHYVSTPTPQPPFVIPPGNHPPLYIPRRSRSTPAEEWHEVSGEIHDAWIEIAMDKGFRIDRRVRDRYHVVLECEECGAHVAQKLFTLRTASVACTACEDARRREAARLAGLNFLGYDIADASYGFYEASCGHTLRRQFELVGRAARGEVEARCEICHLAREEDEAIERGWERLGADLANDPNYRMYRHECGHEQRVARANMQSGHVDCGACGASWSARSSVIYLLDIRHGEDHVLKLGYSNDPERRHRYQLGIPKDASVTILRQVEMKSGSVACSAEKTMHGTLTRHLIEAVVPQTEFAHLLNTTGEVYRPWARPEIESLLDAVVLAQASGGVKV